MPVGGWIRFSCVLPNAMEIDPTMALLFDTFTTRDHLSIRWGYATAATTPARGTVLFLNGRTEYMEKYAEVVEELKRRGFAVYSFDWRGQGLSDRMLPDSQKGHVACFEDYLDDLDQLMTIVQRQGAPLPLIILGHSMGGHMALRFIERHPERFDRVILTSPMIDIQLPGFLPRTWLRWLAHTAAQKGLQGAYVLGAGGVGVRDRRFEGNPLTSDRGRFERNVQMIRRNPRLAVGGVTYGWLDAAMRSIDRVVAPAYARSLRVPILMVTAARDQIVCLRAQAQFCRQAPDCRQVSLAGARHEVLVETDDRRAQFWRLFDDFVTV
jgi:lysophospholipase